MSIDLHSNSAPTPEAMLGWVHILDGDWGGTGDGSFVQAVHEETEVYFQNFEILAPGGDMGVRSGSAPSDADAAIDSLVPADVLITVKPARSRQKYKRQARKLGYFGRGSIEAWRKRRDILRDIASDQVIRRVGVARVLFDDRLWPPMPDNLVDVNDDADEDPDPAEWKRSKQRWLVQNRRRYPIILERRDPLMCRWRQMPDGEILVLTEEYDTSALEAQRVFGHYPRATAHLKGREPNDVIRVKDVWYGKWRAIFLEDQPILAGSGVLPHRYPVIPYIIIPFRELPFQEAERRYRGMLTNSKELYIAESQVLTMTLWLLRWNAWRTWIGHVNDRSRDITVVPGVFLDINEAAGEYLKMLEGSAVPPELFAVIDTVDSYVQRNGVAQGPRTAEGTRSAQQLWGIQAMRQLKIESPKDNLQRAVALALSYAAQILETMVKEPVTLPVPGKDADGEDLGEVEIKPEDIDGYYDGFKVSFSRRLDPALIEQAKALQALATNNWMPLRQSIELSGLADDPQEWLDELLIQSTERLPFILEIQALERIKNDYGEDSEVYLTLKGRVLQGQMAGGGAPGMAPGGAPGVPVGGATPPAPLGMPNQPPGGGSNGASAGRSRVTGNTRQSPPLGAVGEKAT